MKIIDNKKDYYDYLASIYGIDELVVYNRRGSVTLNSDKVLPHGMEYYFSNRILFQDKPLSDKHYWNLRSIAKQREAKDVKHKYGKTWKEGDIYLFSDDKGRYLPVDEVNDLFEANGFFYAKTLFRGTLAECLKYPNAFQSKIAEWLGLPAIDDNICEGIVIRPVVPMYLKNGSRVLIKSKNERFAEKKSVKKRNKLFAEPVPYSETLQALIVEGEAYITENRLTNVLSHIGEVHFPKDFGRVMGLFSKDVLEDFLKEHGGSYSSLDKCEQKSLNKELNKLCTSLVKQVYMSQAYIIE